MKLLDLLDQISYECIQGTTDVEVSAIIYDSRKAAVPGCLFVCIEGTNFDGHGYAKDMAEKGAKVFIVSRPVEGLAQEDVTIIKVEDTRYAMAFISAAWFGNPAQKLKVIGITGTKGKTTTTYLVKSILENAGFKVGLVGTIETIIGDTHIHAEHTTPESYLLQEDFAKMADAGLDAVVMEVSSQALKLHRTQGFIFDYGIFTNLEPDHIAPGEHENFEEYTECKSRLFRQCRVGIVNGDDAHVEEIIKGHSCELETYGMGDNCMLRAKNLELVRVHGELGVDFCVAGLMDFEAKVPMPGRFSVYNALCAIAICRHFEVDIPDICNALNAAKVKGRIEKVKISNKFTLLIDYAHNAMALESLLTTLREYEPKRLVCMFGCGGNRSSRALFNFHVYVVILPLLLLKTSFRPWWSDSTHGIISIFLYLLRPVF